VIKTPQRGVSTLDGIEIFATIHKLKASLSSKRGFFDLREDTCTILPTQNRL
jgi:hypothetical protein